MLGAIIGDIIGSIHENIPKHGKRNDYTITDDSILTYACQLWVDQINNKQLTQLRSMDFNYVLYDELKDNLIKLMKSQFHKFEKYGFSTKFTMWAKSDEYYQMAGDTNGCLMRQSPIAEYCIKMNLNKDILFYLTHLCTSITHENILSHTYTKIHSEIIYDILNKKLTLKNYKNKFKEYTQIETINFWKSKSSKKFIWSAKESLQIALSSVVYANSFDDVMNNCIAIDGDVDTYCAIAGPIAQGLFGIPDELKLKYNQNIEELNT